MFNLLNKAIRRFRSKPERIFEQPSSLDIKPFNWMHLKDKKLYLDNNYALKVLEETTNLDFERLNNKTIYHCYWYGEIGRKQAFSIKSFLCTQNLDKCRLILWLDINNGFQNHEENSILKSILPFIEVRAYDPSLEIQNTPWEKHEEIANLEHNLAARSDAFRFLVLYKYGGLYFDLDVMFLKDLDTLLHLEFCYAWEQQSYANSAILNLKRRSNLSSYILQKSIDKGTPLPWIIFQYSDLELKELCVFPCAMFDPIWQEVDPLKFPISEFSEFFEPFSEKFENKFNISSYKNFFPGCYAYHWHNQWKVNEEENSFFGIFEKEFNDQLGI